MGRLSEMFYRYAVVAMMNKSAETEMIILREGGELRNKIIDEMDGDV